jgi:phosphomannomutase
VIGGEGNGGVIYPAFTFTAAMHSQVLPCSITYLAKSGKTPSELRKTYPVYFYANKR